MFLRMDSIRRSVLSLVGLACVATLVAASPGPASALERQAPENREGIQLSFAPIVKKAAPAVVNIYTKRVVESRARTLFDDPLFQQFFGQDFDFGVPRKRVQNSLGSGVIVRPNGVIVTNNHVIEGADEITVALSDRREFPAKVLLADKRTDLAVLKIDDGTEKLPYLEFENSDDIEVGDLVIAIGNPFGVGQTVTSGIVSALARTQVGVSDYRFFIQTDAAINPGNSGGALVSMDGKVVGINSAIFTQSGGSIGIGWAIPANMVKTVVRGALNEGHVVVRPWLGASTQTVTQDIAASLSLKRPTGVLVNDVYPGGPAAKAGVKVGDVIVAVNSKEVMDADALKYRVGTMEVGGTVQLEVHRDGKDIDVNLPLIAPPETPARNLTVIKGENPFEGAKVGNLSPAYAEDLGLNPMLKGVVIADVQARSIAAYRFQSGDIIVSVNGKSINRVKDLQQVLAVAGGRWDLKIQRDGHLISAQLTR